MELDKLYCSEESRVYKVCILRCRGCVGFVGLLLFVLGGIEDVGLGYV